MPFFLSDSVIEKNGAFHEKHNLLKMSHLEEKSRDQVENRKGTENNTSNFGAFQG